MPPAPGGGLRRPRRHQPGQRRVPESALDARRHGHPDRRARVLRAGRPRARRQRRAARLPGRLRARSRSSTRRAASPSTSPATRRSCSGSERGCPTSRATATRAREFVPTNVVNIHELQQIENFEGQTAWAIGLDRQRDFTVSTLADPFRIVIDIALDPAGAPAPTTTASPAPTLPPTARSADHRDPLISRQRSAARQASRHVALRCTRTLGSSRR